MSNGSSAFVHYIFNDNITFEPHNRFATKTQNGPVENLKSSDSDMKLLEYMCLHPL